MSMEAKAEEGPMTAREMVRGAVYSFGWLKTFEDRILDYCRMRSPSGEVLWTKIREWLAEAGRDEPQAVAWADLVPAERAALDLLAISACGLAGVIGRHFPAPAAAVVVARPTPVEDTIFERHGSIGDRDPHRVTAAAAVARVMEKAGLSLGDVEAALSLDEADAPDDEDEGDEDGEEDDGGVEGGLRGRTGTVIIGELPDLGLGDDDLRSMTGGGTTFVEEEGRLFKGRGQGELQEVAWPDEVEQVGANISDAKAAHSRSASSPKA